MAGQYPHYPGANPHSNPQHLAFNEPPAYIGPQVVLTGFPGPNFPPVLPSGPPLIEVPPYPPEYDNYAYPQQRGNYYNSVTNRYHGHPIPYAGLQSHPQPVAHLPENQAGKKYCVSCQLGQCVVHNRPYKIPIVSGKGEYPIKPKLSQKEKVEALIAEDGNYSVKCERLYRKFAVLFQVYGPMEATHQKIITRFFNLSAEDRKFIMVHGNLDNFLTSSEYFEKDRGVIVLKHEVFNSEHNVLSQSLENAEVSGNSEDFSLDDLGRRSAPLPESPRKQVSSAYSSSEALSNTNNNGHTGAYVRSPVKKTPAPSTTEAQKHRSQSEQNLQRCGKKLSNFSSVSASDLDASKMGPTFTRDLCNVTQIGYEDWGDGLDYSYTSTGLANMSSSQKRLNKSLEIKGPTCSPIVVEKSTAVQYNKNPLKAGKTSNLTDTHEPQSKPTLKHSNQISVQSGHVESKNLTLKSKFEYTWQQGTQKSNAQESVQSNLRENKSVEESAMFALKTNTEGTTVEKETSDLVKIDTCNALIEQVQKLDEKYKADKKEASSLNCKTTEECQRSMPSDVNKSDREVNRPCPSPPSNVSLDGSRAKDKMANSNPDIKVINNNEAVSVTDLHKVSLDREPVQDKSLSKTNDTVLQKKDSSSDVLAAEFEEKVSDFKLLPEEFQSGLSSSKVKQDLLLHDNNDKTKCSLKDVNSVSTASTSPNSDYWRTKKNVFDAHEVNITNESFEFQRYNLDDIELSDGEALSINGDDVGYLSALTKGFDDLDGSVYYSLPDYREDVGEQLTTIHSPGSSLADLCIDHSSPVSTTSLHDARLYFTELSTPKVNVSPSETKPNNSVNTRSGPESKPVDKYQQAVNTCKNIIDETVSSLLKLKESKGSRSQSPTDMVQQRRSSRALSPLAAEFMPGGHRDRDKSSDDLRFNSSSESVLRNSSTTMLPSSTTKLKYDVAVNTDLKGLKSSETQTGSLKDLKSSETQTGSLYNDLVQQAKKAEVATVKMKGQVLCQLLKQEFQSCLKKASMEEDFTHVASKIKNKVVQECKKLKTLIAFHVSALERGVHPEELPDLELHPNFYGTPKHLCVDIDESVIIPETVLAGFVEEYTRSEETPVIAISDEPVEQIVQNHQKDEPYSQKEVKPSRKQVLEQCLKDCNQINDQSKGRSSSVESPRKVFQTSAKSEALDTDFWTEDIKEQREITQITNSNPSLSNETVDSSSKDVSLLSVSELEQAGGSVKQSALASSVLPSTVEKLSNSAPTIKPASEAALLDPPAVMQPVFSEKDLSDHQPTEEVTSCLPEGKDEEKAKVTSSSQSVCPPHDASRESEISNTILPSANPKSAAVKLSIPRLPRKAMRIKEDSRAALPPQKQEIVKMDEPVRLPSRVTKDETALGQSGSSGVSTQAMIFEHSVCGPEECCPGEIPVSDSKSSSAVSPLLSSHADIEDTVRSQGQVKPPVVTVDIPSQYSSKSVNVFKQADNSGKMLAKSSNQLSTCSSSQELSVVNLHKEVETRILIKYPFLKEDPLYLNHLVEHQTALLQYYRSMGITNPLELKSLAASQSTIPIKSAQAPAAISQDAAQPESTAQAQSVKPSHVTPSQNTSSPLVNKSQNVNQTHVDQFETAMPANVAQSQAAMSTVTRSQNSMQSLVAQPQSALSLQLAESQNAATSQVTPSQNAITQSQNAMSQTVALSQNASPSHKGQCPSIMPSQEAQYQTKMPSQVDQSGNITRSQGGKSQHPLASHTAQCGVEVDQNFAQNDEKMYLTSNTVSLPKSIPASLYVDPRQVTSPILHTGLSSPVNDTSGRDSPNLSAKVISVPPGLSRPLVSPKHEHNMQASIGKCQEEAGLNNMLKASSSMPGKALGNVGIKNSVEHSSERQGLKQMQSHKRTHSPSNTQHKEEKPKTTEFNPSVSSAMQKMQHLSAYSGVINSSDVQFPLKTKFTQPIQGKQNLVSSNSLQTKQTLTASERKPYASKVNSNKPTFGERPNTPPQSTLYENSVINSTKPEATEELWDVAEYPELRYCRYDPRKEVNYGTQEIQPVPKHQGNGPVNIPGLTGAMLEGIRKQAEKNKAIRSGSPSSPTMSEFDRCKQSVTEKNMAADQSNPHLSSPQTAGNSSGVVNPTSPVTEINIGEPSDSEWTQVIKKKKRDPSPMPSKKTSTKGQKPSRKTSNNSKASGHAWQAPSNSIPYIPGLNFANSKQQKPIGTANPSAQGPFKAVHSPTPKPLMTGLSPQNQQQTDGSKASNYLRLVKILEENCPGFSRLDLTESIQAVRTAKGGLSGMGVSKIVEECKKYLEYNKSSGQNQKISDDEVESCVICYENLTSALTKKLECGHEFHDHCIKRWVYGQERTCPTCRRLALFTEEFPKLSKN